METTKFRTILAIVLLTFANSMWASQTEVTLGAGSETTVTAIQSAITGALGTHDTVVVVGSFTGATTSLTLDIPAEKTVLWTADYSGTVTTAANETTSTGGLIRVGGAVRLR